MTSKNLCFKLMKEDLKRRVWTIALTILGLVFTILIPTAIKCSEFMEESPTWNVTTRRRMINNILELLGVNGMAVTVLLVASVLWAVSGFHYLHNSKKVDFYHSIPVKRHVLFLASYLNGILVPALIYAAVLLPSVALALRANLGINHIGLIPLQHYLLNMVYYSMLYTTAVVAMMMTGNVVIALLGNGVFWAYGPAVTSLVRGYYEIWFHTFYETKAQAEIFSRFLRYSSPFSNYMFTIFEVSETNLKWGSMLGAAAVTAALAILAYSLYRIRPSEAAGKAMAFPKTEMPIKILLVIPIAVASGMLFYGIRRRVFWMLFGVVFGVLLPHCIMEIIYHFDFRKLFSHRIHLGACMTAAVFLSLAGYYDWYGYDAWLPNASKVSSVAINMGYQDNWITYGSPTKEWEYNAKKGVEEEVYYWGYEDAADYISQNMNITDAYSVLQMAKKGVWAEKILRNKEQITYPDWNRCVIWYRMNNGKTIVRTYFIPMDEEIIEIRNGIHDSIEYKRGQYPLLKQTASETACVNFQQYNKIQPVELKHDEIGHLLNVYQKELEELTIETRKKELPIGTIQFMTEEHKNAWIHQAQDSYKYDNLGERCYYPVYPSFTRTLELLRAAGISLEELDENTVNLVSVYYRNRYDTSGQEAVDYVDTTIDYTDSKDLKILTPALCYRDYCDMNGYYEIDLVNSVDVHAVFNRDLEGETFYEDSDSPKQYRFYLDRNKMDEETVENYHFEKDEDWRSGWGIK